jgi:hypothetical protein
MNPKDVPALRNAGEKKESGMRAGFVSKRARAGKYKLALIALVLLLVQSAASCGARRNDAGAPGQKYSAAQVARDLLVGEKAFLKTAIENHGEDCRSQCTLPTIRDAKLCVRICNGIKLADNARIILEAALDAHCAGPGYLEGTAPCAADPANQKALEDRTKEFQKAVTELRGAISPPAASREGGGQ